MDLYYSVCQLLGSYHFRSPVRKYVLEKFDMRFTTDLLKELDEISASSSSITFTTTPKQQQSDEESVHRLLPAENVHDLNLKRDDYKIF